jgi:ABC-type sugar transport system permease subunit
MLNEKGGALAVSSKAVVRQPRLSLARQEELIAYLFILPSFLGFVVFLVVPMVASLGISLYDWELLTPPTFVGLKNFGTLFTDRVFKDVLVNTVYYTFGLVPLNLVLSLGLALWLNTRLRGLTLYRMAFFLPVVTVTVAVALIWRWMYEPRAGIIDVALRGIGLPGPAWLGDANWAMPALIIMSVWKGFGYKWCCSWRACKAFPSRSTRQPCWTAPAPGSASGASRCPCSVRQYSWRWC